MSEGRKREVAGSSGIAVSKKSAGKGGKRAGGRLTGGGGGTRTYIPTRVSNPIDLAVDAAKTSSNREEEDRGGAARGAKRRVGG